MSDETENPSPIQAVGVPHDPDCPGCATDAALLADGGAIVRDYLAYCVACNQYMQGDEQHTVAGKDYHRDCCPTVADTAPAVQAVIAARPYTRAMKRQMKAWPFKTHLVSCEDCKKTCVIAESTYQLIKQSEEFIPVFCDDCIEQKNAELVCDPTEAQIKETINAAAVIDLRERRN